MSKNIERSKISLKNFDKALAALSVSVATPAVEPRDLSGIIKDFEIVYELTWKTLKKFLEEQGHETTSARDVFSKGFQLSILESQEPWLEMIADRNLTVHTYDENLASQMVSRIKNVYVVCFVQLQKKLKS